MDNIHAEKLFAIDVVIADLRSYGANVNTAVVHVNVLLLLLTYAAAGNRCLTNALVQQLPNAGVIAAQDKFDYRYTSSTVNDIN